MAGIAASIATTGAGAATQGIDLSAITLGKGGEGREYPFSPLMTLRTRRILVSLA